MNRELRCEGIFYMPIDENKTQEQAEKRFFEKLESIGVIINTSCYKCEIQEI